MRLRGVGALEAVEEVRAAELSAALITGGSFLSDTVDERFQELRNGESRPGRKRHQFADWTS